MFPFTSFSREGRASNLKSPLRGGLYVRLRLLLVYLSEESDRCSVRRQEWATDGAEFDRIPGRGGEVDAAAGGVWLILITSLKNSSLGVN